DKLCKISSKYGVERRYINYKEMFESETLDIVSVCVPAELHAEACIAAANSGIRAIFCEKPRATSLKEADDIIRACKQNKVELVVNHTRRWNSSYETVIKILKEKLIGTVDVVAAFSTAGLVNSGTHLFDLLRMYFGDVRSVSGVIIRDESTDPGGRGIITFRNGQICYFNSNYREYVLFGANIYGDKGRLEVGLENSEPEAFKLFVPYISKRESGIMELRQMKYKVPKWTPPIVNTVKNIVNTLDGREDILCTGEDGRASLEIALAFHESNTNKGGEVSLPLKSSKVRVIPRMTSFTKDGKLR
ncbi:MAG: Gfo/Idh/MocA family oxidoreductase, partial [Desulfobacteraceae bacterium]|nr:Gfo/Idh/MocA family oxidoreductase [Desulfobacteraceae bacterium]